MSRHTVIAAATNASSTTESQPFVQDFAYTARPQQNHAGPSGVTSYGATSSSASGSPQNGDEWDAGEGARMRRSDLLPHDEVEEYDDDQPVIDVTWRYMSRLYLLVPVVSLISLGLLVLLVTFAWPPNERERRAGQTYPHHFLPWPFLVGIFASCTVQSLREPVWVISSSLTSYTTLTSTTVHTLIHELLRLSTLPIIVPSPTSGFHSSYYLGLGWGTAEVAWGIVKGWEQLSLYQDVMRLEVEPESNGKEALGLKLNPDDEDDLEEGQADSAVELRKQLEEEDELFRKVDVLERMRSRRELEDVIGIPFPNIPFPLHLLWRLDTLLLNLGLTLILSAFYFNPFPIYRHHLPVATAPREPSRFLWLVWALVALLHIAVSLTWKVVGRVGVGAVTWGGLIVALGSVFAGLGAWGGLV